MSTSPERVPRLREAIQRLPGVKQVELDIHSLDRITERDLSQPGELGDLPQVAIRRTQGGPRREALVTTEIRFWQSREGWTALEFLAWWVRDLARSGVAVQMRALARPPAGYDIQLGRTLKFVIEFFFSDLKEDAAPVMQALDAYADALVQHLEDYADALASPRDPESPDGDVDMSVLRRAAEAGDAASQFELARCYETGEGVGQDDAEAVRWYRRGAEAGEPGSMAMLGECCEHGRGAPRDLREALRWYRAALEQGVDAVRPAIARVQTQLSSG
mgnify:CR=1 FL=1